MVRKRFPSRGIIIRMKRPSHPTPPPQTPQAKRLEYIRTQNGFLSLRSFRDRVVEGWRDGDGPMSVSYEAVRTYHYDAKTGAWAPYLARVAALFGYRVEWLITGEEPMYRGAAKALTPGPDRVREVALKKVVLLWMDTPGRALVDASPAWLTSLTGAFMELAVDEMRKDPTLADDDARAEASFIELLEVIGKAVAAPLRAFPDLVAAQMDERTLGDYINAMIPPLLLLVRERSRQWREARAAAPEARDSAAFDEMLVTQRTPTTKRRKDK